MPDATAVQTVKAKSGNLTVERISSRAELEKLSESWQALSENCAPDQFFVSCEFVSSWWKAYGTGRELFVLLCGDERGRVVGIAPLYRETNRSRVGLETRVLRLIGDGSDDADGFGFLISHGCEIETARAIFTWLSSNSSEWDLLEFNSMLEDTSATQTLLRQVEQLQWVSRIGFAPHLQVVLPRTWEEYLRGLSAKVRQTWLRKIRRSEENHGLRLRQTRSAAELEADLTTAFDLHNKSWNAKAKHGKLESATREEFYRSACRTALQKGELDLWFLESEGVACAVRLGFHCGKTRYAVLAGLDPEFAHLSPGTVLEALVLKQCIERGDDVYDFLGGDEEYKIECRPLRRRYVNLTVARPRTRTGIQLKARDHIRAGTRWMRNEFPSAYAVARRVRQTERQENAARPSFELRLIRERRDFDELQKEWKALFAKNEREPIFLSWEWMSCWLDAYGARELYVLAASAASGECIGIAPLYLSRWPSAGRASLRVLKLIGDETGDSGQLGLLIKKVHEREFSASVIEWLDSHRSDWDALELQSLQQDDKTSELLSEMGRRSWIIRQRKSCHMVISLPDSIERFQAGLSRGVLKWLAAPRKQLVTRDVRFRRWDSPDGIDLALDDFFRLHTLRRKQLGDSGAFADQRRRTFYQSVTASMLASDRLDLWSMSIDGKTVAAEYGLINGKSRVSMQSGFDPAFGRLHVGSLLEEKVIQESIQRGVRSYDLMEGEQAYKKGWGAHSQELTFVRCSPPRTVGAGWVKLSGSGAAQNLWRKLKAAAGK
jgi:CelD/BcsL family acetyltransferase involved in cellulose biosynthesis